MKLGELINNCTEMTILRIFFPPYYYKRIEAGHHALTSNELTREVESVEKISDYVIKVKCTMEVGRW